MSPRRPRRRARRRSPAGPILTVAAVAVLAALLIGGLAAVSRQSQGYDAASNRTLAALGAVVAKQSNATGSSATALLNTLQTQNRVGLQIALDNLVRQTAAESARAAAAADATPLGSVRADFAAVFADRATSMRELRAAIDGYLGMHPLPVAGTTTTVASAAGPDAATLLTATDATNRIAAAGALLARSDALYGSARRTLRAAAGHGRLPRSVWVRDPQLWAPANVASQVDLVATSPTLAAVHGLLLRTVRISPPALPTPVGASANVAVITPTTQLSVNVVLANDGSVDEPHATVRYTLASQSSGATSSQAQTLPLAAATSQALPTATFAVKPGTTYVLTVSVDVPAGQTQTAGTAAQYTVTVSPAT
jgi:hypothetical protein